MPIRKENRDRYPKDFKAIRARIQARAGDKCEECGVPNGAFIQRDRKGAWHELTPMEAETAQLVDGEKVTRIVCTTGHLNHQPEDNRDENLRFLCQKHHLAFDAKYHAANAADTRRRRRELTQPSLAIE